MNVQHMRVAVGVIIAIVVIEKRRGGVEICKQPHIAGGVGPKCECA